MTATLSGDALTERIIEFAIDVHRHFGPGLLESAKRRCLGFISAVLAVDVQTHAASPVMDGLVPAIGYP